MTQGDLQEKLVPACRKFLYMSMLPQGNQGPRLELICQYYNGKARFVTLYDTLHRIPVYSAYTFKRSDGSRKVDVPWMYEPQLSIATGSRDMEQFPQRDLHRSADDAQAVLEDYRDTVDIVRGQLNPDQHQSEFDDQAATYTMTNVVPLIKEFSEGPWAAQEKVTRQRLNNYCRGTAYVVTGVLTSGRALRRFDADRVAVPDYVWSAYCCDDYDCNAPYHEFSRFPAFASLGRNRRLDNTVEETSVQQLEDFIKRATGKKVNIFYKDCN
ncbi:endonuclease domain-containing 1 protein-like [Gadus chalcogrammus]|uniref:endonuclease domain-containing 1 protein-like n=1 Tax=Gadus chalcogrammus TaxID=1042646 RepID=UPI0024C4BB24|nr:endonuclease domain-containing 1 protein-like [Gadus chalcogrammus]